MYSTTAAIGNWSARQDLHLVLAHGHQLGPKPSMLLLHYALVAPANGWRRGLVSVEMESMHLGELDSIEDGGPEGSRTLNPPADNGALC